MADIETHYFGDGGFLHPYDIRFDANDRAFCDPLPDGTVRFRLWTELNFARVVLVFNDGTAQGRELTAYAEDRRFKYWETVVRPTGWQMSYSFALRTADGKSVYWCRQGVSRSAEVLDRWQLDLQQAQPYETPDWAKGAVIYQIFPDRFANGEPANDPVGTVPWGSPAAWLDYQGGDLQGVTQHLDALEDLGVDAIYLNPIFSSPSTHKYDCSDFYHVDPGFGGDHALHELVAAAHQRGMKVILDASFNHCHPRFFAFQDLIANGPDSAYRDWFTVHHWPVRVRYRPHLAEQARQAGRETYLRFLESFPKVTGVELDSVNDEGPLVEATYLAWHGVLDMPKLNLSNPSTRAYFLDVTRYWIREFKIDGWRMDVTKHVVPDFWDDFRRAAKEANPECYLLAEVWGNTSPWLQGSQFDATMNYIFRDLVVDYFGKQQTDTAAFLDGVTRMLSLYAPQVMHCNQNLFSSHDVPRLLHEAAEDVTRLRLATLFQLTLPGAPGIYYGDEIAMSGGDDPDNRRAFPWHEPDRWDRETLALTRSLIQLRKKHPALRRGDWRLAWAGENAFAFERTHEADRVLVLINRGERLEQLLLPVRTKAPEVLWGQAEVSADSAGLVIKNQLAADGSVIRL